MFVIFETIREFLSNAIFVVNVGGPIELNWWMCLGMARQADDIHTLFSSHVDGRLYFRLRRSTSQ
jgi:hypothetical protein